MPTANPSTLTWCKQSPEEAAETIEKLRARIRELEAQVNKNSRNSSKPPSTDGFKKPEPKSLRPKSNKSTGGQKGHQGKTLGQDPNPDEIVTYPVDQCHQCGHSLADVASRVERRQLFDIPPISIATTEYRGEIKSCPICQAQNRASFPQGVEAPVQYGPNLKALGVYLHHYQLLPYKRICELLGDLVDQPVSQATLVDADRQAYQKLEGVEETVAQQLRASSVAHFDETGVDVNGKGQWLHVASTDTLTHYTVDPKRGQKGINAGGILPDFDGVAVHDAWKPYFKYNCDHALCNAHHLRELTGIYEQEGQQWAKDMMDLLVEMKEATDTQRILDVGTLLSFERKYDALIKRGLTEDGRCHPPQPEIKGKRGRKKQSPAKNLLDRLQTYRSEVLGFIKNPLIPFDNNQAERDVRMAKVQKKISGPFRSESGANRFSRIRGYISTMKKQSHSVMEALYAVMVGDPLQPSTEKDP